MEASDLEQSIKKAVHLISDADAMAVLTGAGISKESGIPTFRDAQTGLWENFNPEDLATKQGFLANPSLVWDWYDHRRNGVWDSKPNGGHLALAEIQQAFNTAEKSFALITQNVDNLHELAGSDPVLHLHGSIFDFKRLDDNAPFDLETLSQEERSASPPKCPETGSYIRPNVVWFGEMLPEDILDESFQAAARCNVMLVIGTSGIVHPAASIPVMAKQNGAIVIEVNPEPSALTNQIVDIFLQGPSGSILPKVFSEIKV